METRSRKQSGTGSGSDNDGDRSRSQSPKDYSRRKFKPNTKNSRCHTYSLSTRLTSSTYNDPGPVSSTSSLSNGAGPVTVPTSTNPFAKIDPKLMEEILIKRIEQRIQQEILEKAKVSESMQQVLEDRDDSKKKFEVALALADYLQKLQYNLANHPEEFHCSMDSKSTPTPYRKK